MSFEFGAAFSSAVGAGDLQSPFPPELSWAALLVADCGIIIAWLSCLEREGKDRFSCKVIPSMSFLSC